MVHTLRFETRIDGESDKYSDQSDITSVTLQLYGVYHLAECHLCVRYAAKLPDSEQQHGVCRSHSLSIDRSVHRITKSLPFPFTQQFGEKPTSGRLCIDEGVPISTAFCASRFLHRFSCVHFGFNFFRRRTYDDESRLFQYLCLGFKG